jgi:hypothetical protein
MGQKSQVGGIDATATRSWAGGVCWVAGGTGCPMIDVRCVGCEAMVPSGESPTHPYMWSAAGRWERYCSLGESKGRLSGEESIGIVQDLVDSFAVQHATNTNRRNVQSV